MIISSNPWISLSNPSRSRSQTTFTRGGGEVLQKCWLFQNVYKVENVNIRWQVVKPAKTYQNNLWTTQKLLRTPKARRAPEERGLPHCVIILVAFTLIWTWKFHLEILWVKQDLGCTLCGSIDELYHWKRSPLFFPSLMLENGYRTCSNNHYFLKVLIVVNFI